MLRTIMLVGLVVGCSAAMACESTSTPGNAGGAGGSSGSPDGAAASGGAGAAGAAGSSGAGASAPCFEPAVTLAPGQGAGAITVDATNVYWANGGSNGSIMRLPIGGGTPTTVAAAQDGPIAIAVYGSDVYWVNCAHPTPAVNPNCTIMKASSGGGEAKLLAGGQSDVWGLAVNASGVYWTSGAPEKGGGIRMVAPNGGTPVQLAQAASPMGIALDADSVYWTEFEFDYHGQVRKMPLGGGALTTLFAGDAGAWAIAVHAPSVFWTLGGAVMTIQNDGGPAAAVACGARGMDALAADAASVFWTRDADGALMSSPLGGGNSTVVAPAQDAGHIATDDANVYWTTGAEVRMASKCGSPPGDAGTVATDTSCYVTPDCKQGITCTSPHDCPAPPTKCTSPTCDSFCCGTAQTGLCILDGSATGDCPTCVEQMCATVIAVCEANSSCAALAQCYATCADSACMASCDAQYPGGTSGMNTLFACATQGCATECWL